MGGRATIQDLVGVTGLPSKEIVRKLDHMSGRYPGSTPTVVRVRRMTYALADDDVVSDPARSVRGGVA